MGLGSSDNSSKRGETDRKGVELYFVYNKYSSKLFNELLFEHFTKHVDFSISVLALFQALVEHFRRRLTDNQHNKMKIVFYCRIKVQKICSCSMSY